MPQYGETEARPEYRRPARETEGDSDAQARVQGRRRRAEQVAEQRGHDTKVSAASNNGVPEIVINASVSSSCGRPSEWPKINREI